MSPRIALGEGWEAFGIFLRADTGGGSKAMDNKGVVFLDHIDQLTAGPNTAVVQ